MSKSWATKRWILAVAAAAGLLGLVLKISEISRPGRAKPAEQHAAMRPARPAERHAAAPSPGGPVDWPSAGLAPDTAPAAPADADARKRVDSGETTPDQTDTEVEVRDVKKLTGGAGSMSFWLQPGWDEGNHDDATFVQRGDNRLQVIKNVNFLRFEFLDDNGIPGGIGAPIAEWKAGEWHQVTTTWNGGQFSMYLDGQLVSQTVHDGRVDLTPDTKLFIGSDFPESRPVAPGVIGKVDLQNRPLSPGEVADPYQSATGPSGHK